MQLPASLVSGQRMPYLLATTSNCLLVNRMSAAMGSNVLRHPRAGQPQSNDRARYIGGYFGFAIGFVVMTMCRSLLNLYSAWRASRAVCKSCPLSTFPVLFYGVNHRNHVIYGLASLTAGAPELATQAGRHVCHVLRHHANWPHP
jgi:hypothetical protein